MAHEGEVSRVPAGSTTPAQTEGVDGAAAQDEVLRGLRQALDLPGLRSRLRPFFSPDFELDTLELHHVAYDPGVSASIAYRLRLLERRGNVSTHFMTGLLKEARKLISKAERLRDRARLQPPHGPAFVLFEDLEMILLGFPNDPKLQGLDALGPLNLSRRLVSLLGEARIGSDEIVRYVPGKRLVMRHAVERSGEHFFTKTVARDRGRIGLHVAENLWRASRADAEAFVVPRPRDYLPESQTLVQEDLHDWAPILLPPPEGWQRWGGAVGRALARMHRTTVPRLQRWSDEEALGQLSAALKRLVRFDASQQSLCEELWRQGRCLPGKSPAPEVPIHTAFRVTQMLTRGGRLALLDLEGFRLGDPHGDLGNMLAYLRKQVLEGRQQASDVEEGVRALMDAYADDVPWDLSQKHLDWYTAIHLVAGYAKGCLSRLEAGLKTKIPVLLAEALRRFPSASPQGNGAAAVSRSRGASSFSIDRADAEARGTMGRRARLAADPSSMQGFLSPLLKNEELGEAVRNVEVLYVAAVPEADCRAWYAVRCVAPDGTQRERFFAGFMHSAASEKKRRSRQEEESCWQAPIRRSLVIPQLDMELWELPDDPSLSGLSRLVNRDFVRAILAESLSLPCAKLEHHLVRYVPGKRAVLRFDFTPTSGSGENQAPRPEWGTSRHTLFCKIYENRKAAQRAAHRCESLWEACRSQPLAMPTPRPLYVDRETASLWFRGFAGEVLDAAAPEEALLRMGTGLAALHGTGLSLPNRWDPARELESMRHCARLLAEARPEVAGSIREIRHALEASLEQLDFGPFVPCHGSFKLNHVMWDGQEASLLDVDSALTASPWLDVANLMSHLHYLTCQGTLSPERARRLAAVFRTGYEGQAPWAWNDAALDWCTASVLVRKQAYKCVKHLHADPAEKLEGLLAEASARCGRFQA